MLCYGYGYATILAQSGYGLTFFFFTLILVLFRCFLGDLGMKVLEVDVYDEMSATE